MVAAPWRRPLDGVCTGDWMMLGCVVGTVGVTFGAFEVAGDCEPELDAAEVDAGDVAVDDGATVDGAVADGVDPPSSLAAAGVTTGTVVDGDDAVLDLATPARSPTPATLPAATSKVMLPTRERPSSRAAGVRGRIVMPAILAARRKGATAGR